MFKKSRQEFSRNQDGPRFSADEIKLHNDNAKLRNKVSKEYEAKRRRDTLKALDIKSTQTEINIEPSQLESNKAEINIESSQLESNKAEINIEASQLESNKAEINIESSSSNISESSSTNNINKI